MRALPLILAAILPSFSMAGSPPAHAATAVLRWTATGDDSLFGQARAYDLRYSTSPITASNFGSAIGVPNLPFPSPSGTPESFKVTGLTTGLTYYFAIKARDEVGHWSNMSNVLAKLATGTVDVASPSLSVLSFSSPRPNPARAGSSFLMELPSSAKVVVEAFDVSGRRVRTIVDQEYQAGEQMVRWDLYDDHGVRLPAGLYHVRARIGDTTFVRSVAVL
ncbi:MAG: hypothetical protein E6K80_13985 [Candidatus Eisenbacteria bacterium]|uniref:FlgD/Vpr Ig-like domain-containing protein n=1 Tax=Eiseniibacteriota bacterium TaxID=2212470 RepID=A0A538TYI6_UNCEI|nr:MAG: hypothetical protein E6K80_13985 [Candidatus Eisenbacteria bacterium]